MLNIKRGRKVIASFGIGAAIAYIIFILGMGFGYLWNIYEIGRAAFTGSEFTLLLAIKILGVFAAPVGSIMGLFF